jgi:hypothetical protein
VRCKDCGVKMREEKRSFHKRRKWVCPLCGKARMQATKTKGNRAEG